jgi:ER-bound oxygenase mpaB/B'/Rubber oxygenase, catalytic domain
VQPILTANRGRFPSDFARYWENQNTGAVRRARRVFKAVFRFDLLPPPEIVEKLALGYFDGDPLADAFVEAVYTAPSAAGVWRMFEQAIEHGADTVPDAPEALTRLFAELEHEPDWVDHDLVERGAKTFRRYGPAAFSLAGASTLLGYTESSIAKPLSLTGAYTGDSARRRHMQTARFWIDISEPGGLREGGRGRATAMRVRVMHAVVRRKVLEHREWDLAAWGVPICQADALLTLIAGSLAPGLGLRLMGYRTSVAEIEAMMHFWRYVGHLMGVRPRWYPTDVREAIQISAAFTVKRRFDAGADGVELVESYPAAFRPRPGTTLRQRLRDEVNYRAQLGYTRYFLPRSFYRRYDLPNPWPWALHPLLQAPVIFVVESLRRRTATVERLQDRYASWRRESWWRNEMGDEQPVPFRAGEQLRR